MDDIDELFTQDLNEGLADELNGHLESQLAVPLNGQLDLAPSIPPPGLAERLDELHAGGCNQSIAWSRLGAVACIGADRKSVTIQCLQFQQDGNWRLNQYTESTLMDKLQHFYSGYDFVHVAWGATGTDLLVIDACGRIAIGFVWVALNRVVGQRKQNHDPEDNLNAIVAIRWLNQIKKPVIVAGTATKENGRWRYPTSQIDPRGPFSPNQKSSFVAVTRGAMIKLFVQSAQTSEWVEIKYELDGLSSSQDLITHATMCSEKGQPKKDDEILLAVHTVSRKLRLYTIRIDWQGGVETPSASIHVQHITQLDRCLPQFDHNLLSESMGFVPQEPELCILSMLPRITRPGQTTSSPPVILAAFSHTTASGQLHTIISRWEVDESAAIIDPTFGQLSTKRSLPGNLPEEKSLKLLDEVNLDRLVINLELHQHDTMIGLCYSTGDVDMRNRDFSIPQLEEKIDKASSLIRLGFSFDNVEPCLEASLAPHSTIKVSLNKARECKVSSMHLNLPLVTSDTISQVAATFLLLHAATESVTPNPTDDILMTMWEFLQNLEPDQRTAMNTQFMKDFYQILQVTDKCADTNMESLIKFAGLARTVSVQSALGVLVAGPNQLSWTRPGKIGFTVQSLRVIALSLSFSVAVLQKGQDIDLYRPETLDYITPQIKWFITLTDYILDQLFHINRIMGTTEPFDGQAVQEKIEPSYTCLVLIMCTITRNYLRFIIRAIRALPNYLQSAMTQAQPGMHAKYTALSNALRSGVVPPPQLDQILEITDSVLAQFYSRMRPGQRQEIEMQLLAEATIPTILHPIISKLLAQPIESVRVKLADLEETLFFRPWSTVTLADDEQKKKWAMKTEWDSTRKVELSGKAVVKRRCLRCTGAMEEPEKEKLGRGWMGNLTKTCFCGGHWIIEKSVGG